MGVIGKAYLTTPLENANAERVFVLMAESLSAPFITGIIWSAILAAIMSTSSSQLLVTSSAVSRDLFQAFLCKDVAQCFDIVNKIAPEHLEVEMPDPKQYLPLIYNAGAIFLGKYTSEPLGDYMAGPNHTLPTSGTAAFSSPLGVYDFVKHSSVEMYNKEAFQKISKKVQIFAEAEGLTAHAHAMEVRDED